MYLIGYGWYRTLTLGNGLRPLFRPLRPDLDPFLFAMVGEERNGIPLSTISALTQLGLDPWEEAGHLAGLAKGKAIERLTELLLRLPDGGRPPAEEVRQIAIGLIDVLRPSNGVLGFAKPQEPAPLKIVGNKAFWVSCFVLTAVAFFVMFANG